MWKRKELKFSARSNLKKRYWLIVLICFLMAYLCGEYGLTTTLSKSYTDSLDNASAGTTQTTSQRTLNTDDLGVIGVFIDNTEAGHALKKSYEHPTKGVLTGMLHSTQNRVPAITNIYRAVSKFIGGDLASAFVALGAVLLYIACALFIKNILIVGERRWFLENRLYDDTSITRIGFVYRDRCVPHVALVMFVMNVKLFLWFLTIIGGVIKYFEYKLIPYILAENPDTPTKDVFKLARAMMKGYKWKLFVLYLSFWYWMILSTASAGLLRLFFLNGYTRGTEAEFFVRVRHEAIANQLPCAEYFHDATLYVSPDPELTMYPGVVRKDLKTPITIDYDRKYSIINIVLMFFMFSIFGWCWEVSLHLIQHGVFVNRGTMYGPWLPIYGTGGMLVLLLLKRFRKNPPLTFLLTMVVCGTVEYLTSYFLEVLNGQRWWDYSGYFLNINGRICLEGLLVFAIGGTIFIYLLAPLNDQYLNKIPIKIRTVIAVVLIAAFGVDATYSHFVPNSGKGITDYGSILDYKIGGSGSAHSIVTASSAHIPRLN